MKPYTIVENKWRINANKLSYILEEYVAFKKGNKFVWRPYGYYGTVAELLRSWAELSIRVSDKELVEAIKTAVWDLNRIKKDLQVGPDAEE